MINKINESSEINKNKILFFKIFITKVIYSNETDFKNVYGLFINNQNNFCEDKFDLFISEIIDKLVLKSGLRINYSTFEKLLGKQDIEHILDLNIDDFIDITGFGNELSAMMSFYNYTHSVDASKIDDIYIKAKIKSLFISTYLPVIQNGFSQKIIDIIKNTP